MTISTVFPASQIVAFARSISSVELSFYTEYYNCPSYSSISAYYLYAYGVLGHRRQCILVADGSDSAAAVLRGPCGAL